MKKISSQKKSPQLAKLTPTEVFSASELRYRRLFETAQDGILLVDAKTGMIMDANQFLIDLLGYSKKDFLKKYLWEVGVFKNIARSKSSFKVLQRKKYIRYENLPLETKAGKPIEVEFVSNVYTVGEEIIIQCNIRDISERTKSAAMLAETSSKLERVFHNMSDGLINIDVTGKFNQVNPAALAVLGLTKEQFMNHTPDDQRWHLLKADGVTPYPYKDQPFMVALLTGKKTADIMCLQLTNNGRRYIEVTAVPYNLYSGLKKKKAKERNVLVTFKDITERFKFEQELKKAKDDVDKLVEQRTLELKKQKTFLDSVVQRVPNMIFVKDAKNLKFELFNEAGEKLLGQKRKDLLGKSDYDFFPKAEADFFVAKDRQVLKSGKLLDIPEEPIQTKSGLRYLHTQKIPLYDEAGKPEFLLGISEDITERKKMAEQLQEYAKGKLKESETRFRAILDSTFHFAGLLNLDGYLLFANQSALKFIGQNIEDVTSKPFWETHWWRGNAERVMQLRQAIARVKKGETVRYEVELQGQGTTTAIMDFSLRPVFDDAGRVVMMVPEASDITERKQATLALAADEERFRTIFEDNPMAVALVGLDSKFIKVNSAASKLWGYSEAELKKLTFGDITHPDDAARDIGQIKRLVKGEIPRYDAEKRYIKKNKGVIYARNSVSVVRGEKQQPLYLIAVVEDITIHKLYEEQIKASEKKYSSLVENSNDGVIVVQDGLIKYANKSLEKLAGFQLSEVINKSFLSLVAVTDRERVEAIVTGRLNGEKTVSRYEFNMLLKDGGSIMVEVNASLIDFEGRPAALAIIRDVSRAKQIDKIKSEFISVASHQLRSPLTGIKWFSQLLADQKVGQLTDKQTDFVQQIYSSNERMIRLVNDLLDVSHIETGQKFSIDKKPGNIVALVNGVVTQQKIITPQREIVVKVDKACPQKVIFNFDDDKLFQAISNLVDNALKYSVAPKQVMVDVNCNKDTIQIAVKDFGYGIPERQKERIFQKFVRCDNISTVCTEGTGLGLYIAKSIVEAHGGKIWFESKQNKGTTFYISLPKK